MHHENKNEFGTELYTRRSLKNKQTTLEITTA